MGCLLSDAVPFKTIREFIKWIIFEISVIDFVLMIVNGKGDETYGSQKVLFVDFLLSSTICIV